MSDFPPQVPLSFIYGAIAIIGGCARYLAGYVDGRGFKLRVFFASAFVSGFSGWTFAYMGASLQMPQEIIYIMAGLGGFMGEQTMKLIMEYVVKKL